MDKFTIISAPRKNYEDMSALLAAKTYTQNTNVGCGGLVDFDPTYAKKLVWHENRMMEQIEVPDFEEVIGEKGGFELMLSLFARRPVLKVGDIDGDFISTRYLFGPDMGLGDDLYSPDMDVIEIRGEHRVADAAFALAKFYMEEMGWRTCVFNRFVADKRIVVPTSQRFSNGIVITNPLSFRELASKTLGHSLTDLCFEL